MYNEKCCRDSTRIQQDKLGRWRLAEVPPYSTDPRESSAVEARIKELGLLKKYLKKLNNIAHAKNLPAEWASPDQRCRAAIRAVRTPLRLIRRSTDEASVSLQPFPKITSFSLHTA